MVDWALKSKYVRVSDACETDWFETRLEMFDLLRDDREGLTWRLTAVCVWERERERRVTNKLIGTFFLVQKVQVWGQARIHPGHPRVFTDELFYCSVRTVIIKHTFLKTCFVKSLCSTADGVLNRTIFVFYGAATVWAPAVRVSGPSRPSR